MNVLTFDLAPAMTPAWTGGQYSVFRALFGSYLLVQFCQLAPFYPFSHDSLFRVDSPIIVAVLACVGTLASIALLIGKQDRIAALILALISIYVLSRNFLLGNPDLYFVGLLLVAHSSLQTRPFGSWDARGRTDPNSGWQMPATLYTAMWVVTILGVSYFGAARLVSPAWIVASTTAAGLLLLSLALLPKIRPWLWMAFFSLHLALMATDFTELSSGTIWLHLFTLDPGWIRPRLPKNLTDHTLVFYDGACGLCHRAIRFLLAEDAAGLRFRFAPLDSAAFRSASAAPESGFESGQPIPDSLLVHRPGAAMLSRAEGILEISHQLGGLWRLIAIGAGWIPIGILNAGYDFIARIRHRLFARADEVCPILEPHLRDRFQF